MSDKEFFIPDATLDGQWEEEVAIARLLRGQLLDAVDKVLSGEELLDTLKEDLKNDKAKHDATE